MVEGTFLEEGSLHDLGIFVREWELLGAPYLQCFMLFDSISYMNNKPM